MGASPGTAWLYFMRTLTLTLTEIRDDRMIKVHHTISEDVLLQFKDVKAHFLVHAYERLIDSLQKELLVVAKAGTNVNK